jgi:uncharacterized protein (DUF362 family)
MVIEQKKFVKIETLFSGINDRGIVNLARTYDDRDLLKEKILKVGKGFIDDPGLITGAKIFLKPNWVRHNLVEHDEVCLRTNNSFLLAAVEILLEKKPASITIGDAPIQGCNWEKMISKEFCDEISRLDLKYSVPIKIMDFRRVTFDPALNNPQKDRHPLSEYVIFDLGEKSSLEPISSKKHIFRVNSYNPDRLAQSHSLGIHKYCITKELFNADVVLSMPKIKTHQKTGLTGAMKNLVGMNGDKDFLPHHRVGGKGFGGDCYPGKNILRRASEYFMDCADKNQGKKKYWLWLYTGLILWKLSFPKKVHHLSAAWYGNDTCWRMVMDLNRIAVYGKPDGTLSDKPLRKIYSLCDGIISGQGDGPLYPTPHTLGVVSFTNHSALNDICMAILMGFDIQKISMLRVASADVQNQNVELSLNGANVTLSDLSNYAIQTIPPQGWIDYLEK